MWLLYSCEAVRCKHKKINFLPVFELMSDSLTTIFFQELGNLKNSVFLRQPFSIFLLHPHENQSKLLGYQGWVKILMITLVVLNQLKNDSYC